MEIKLDEKGSLQLLSLGDYGLDVWQALKNKLPLPKDKPIEASSKKRVLLIGWDSADWSFINPLIEQGKMPALKKLVEQGASGPIKTLEPSFSPMLWTSIATGKYADKHGILGFVEATDDVSSIRPTQSTSRKCHALWNILGSKGLKSNVIGWWPSHPAEPINGVMVTNQFHKVHHRPDGQPAWKTKDTVYPISMEEELSKCRVHPSDLTEAHILPFVPEAGKVNQDSDKSLSILADGIAQLATVQASTTHLMRNTDWDLTAVYFNDLDRISHQFGKFTPPKLGHIEQEQFELYHGVVEGAYRLLDMMLDRLITLAGESTDVVLLSDHGFKLGDQKLKGLPNIPAAIVLEHNQEGIVCMNGPSIKNGNQILNASLLDITPTILHLLDIQSGKDMDGKTLLGALRNQSQLEPIESWENQTGEFGRHPEEIQTDMASAKEALDQLIELGYIDELDDDVEEQLDEIFKETKYNLSKVKADQGLLAESLEFLEDLYKLDRVDIRLNNDLIRIHTLLGNHERAHEILKDFRKFDISKALNFDRLEGQILVSEKKYKEACDAYLKAHGEKPKNPTIMAELGMVMNKMGKSKKAIGWLRKAITADSKNPKWYVQIGIAQIRQGNLEDAIEPIIAALELKPEYPSAHYHLGECLYLMEEYKEAEKAFETCLMLNPGLNRARNQLMNIYKFHLKDEKKYAQHRELFIRSREDEIIVVTGLPRSGTSMLMQMLHHGGIDIFYDDERLADESNPKGYFEAEVVKGSRKSIDWLPNAAGKAVKVVTPLLPALKLTHSFKVIWIDRNMTEVMMSQEAMLARNDPNRSQTLNLAVQQQYKKMSAKSEEFLAEKNNIEVLRLNYSDIISDSKNAAEAIYEFLGGHGDAERMAAAVDASLYRTKMDKEFTL